MTDFACIFDMKSLMPSFPIQKLGIRLFTSKIAKISHFKGWNINFRVYSEYLEVLRYISNTGAEIWHPKGQKTLKTGVFWCL